MPMRVLSLADAVGAQVGVIISTILPKGVDDRVEGVWVGSMRHAVPLARALRQGIIEAATATWL
jgi:hypothetical protein